MRQRYTSYEPFDRSGRDDSPGPHGERERDLQGTPCVGLLFDDLRRRIQRRVFQEA